MLTLWVDAHSKWKEVHPVRKATSLITTQELRTIFATHGLQRCLSQTKVQFLPNADFGDFTHHNAIRHATMAPYHPSSNSLAEWAVETFKSTMKKETPGPMETRMAKFLFHYLLRPRSSTGYSLAEILLGQFLRSLLGTLKPNVSEEYAKVKKDRSFIMMLIRPCISSSQRARCLSTTLAKSFH